MSYKCPKCGLVYEKEDYCPLCGLLKNAPYEPPKPTDQGVPDMDCPECGREMEHGILQIESSGRLGYGTKWFPQGAKVDLGPGGELFHPFHSRISGAICRDCGLVLLRWKDLPMANTEDLVQRDGRIIPPE